MKKIEKVILSNLFTNENFMRRALPFLKAEYFQDSAEKVVYKHIDKFIGTYNSCPTKEAIDLAIQDDPSVGEEVFKEVQDLFADIGDEPTTNEKWLLDNTEKFCKDRAVYNAIVNSITIIDGKHKELSPDSIPSLLQEALAVCFDSSVGHDYFEDAAARFEFYNRVESRLPFDLELFNKITGGGLKPKTLNVALAGTGGGKSLFMCHFSASTLRQGKNVLYITNEMAEEEIAARIDANLLDIPIGQLKEVPKEMFQNRVTKVLNKTQGRLIIKEYPTSTAHANHFRALLNELQLKRNFKPDLIVIDYLNICISSRYKASSGANSYTIVKAIAEELRGLAVEYDVPILTATQTTRSGYANSDVEITDTSESFGLPATADLMFALINTEELEKLGQLMVKQLKNRYNDPSYYKRFVIGIDRPKMRLFDLEQSAQDLTDVGIRDSSVPFTKKRDFSSIKV